MANVDGLLDRKLHCWIAVVIRDLIKLKMPGLGVCNCNCKIALK